MKIIILAAGKGERLWPLTKDTPKPLVEVREGVSLLEEQLGRISASGVIDRVEIVTGYLGHKVDEMVAKLEIDNLEISTVYNPFYMVSNNLASLWVAKNVIDEDCMVTNGDNLFHSDVFKDFCDECQDDGIYLSLGEKDEFDDDDMKVTLHDGLVIHVSKDIPKTSRHAESPGLCLVRGEQARQNFQRGLDVLMTRSSELNSFWLRIFTYLAEHDVAIQPWYFDAETKWKEVDIHPDIDQMREYLAKVVMT